MNASLRSDKLWRRDRIYVLFAVGRITFLIRVICLFQSFKNHPIDSVLRDRKIGHEFQNQQQLS
jgi:hypothetical protein